MFRLTPKDTTKVVQYMNSNVENAQRAIVVEAIEDMGIELNIRERIYCKDGLEIENDIRATWIYDEYDKDELLKNMKDDGIFDTEFISIKNGELTLYEVNGDDNRGVDIGIYKGRYVDIVKQILLCILEENKPENIDSRLKDLEKKEPMFTFYEETWSWAEVDEDY